MIGNPLNRRFFQCVLVVFCIMSGVYFPVLSAQSSPAPSASLKSLKNPMKYVLRPTDLLHVEVFQEPDLEKKVRVEADGTIVLPLIGKVIVGGKTLSDAQDYIQRLYDKDYIVNPQVNLLILEYSPRRIQVLGQVNKPGFVDIPPEEQITVTQAISGAMGFTRLANENDVQIRREDENGKIQVIVVDVREILTNPQAKDIQLRDKDVVFVRESRI